MGRVEDLERAVRDLSPEDFKDFREWFFEFDAELWDRQIEEDVAAGRLDRHIEKALDEHRKGRTRPL